MIAFTELQTKLKEKPFVWVTLHDSTVICLIGIHDDTTFKAKFLPCASKAREYLIKHSEVKEYARK